VFKEDLMMMDVIAHTPYYVWVMMVFLFWNGYQSCFARTRSLGRLTLIPALFIWLEYNSLEDLFGLTPVHALMSLLGLGLGFALGVAITQGKRVCADRAKGLIRLPGDRSNLALIVINFPFQYLLHVAFQLGVTLPHGFWGAAIALMGFLTGVSLGRSATFICKYFRAENTALA